MQLRIFLAPIFLLLTHVLVAQDGDPDPAFGSNGIVTESFTTFQDDANDMVIQGDGKLVTVGTTVGLFGGGGDLLVARFNTDGTPDASFGSGGSAVISAPPDFLVGNAVSLQADGKIVIVGTASSMGLGQRFFVVRLNTDGTSDTSFDGDGLLILAVVPNGNAQRGNEVMIQADGKIIAGGWGQTDIVNGADFALVRLNVDGTLDSSFGGDGIVTCDFNIQSDLVLAVAIQADGKILAAGSAEELGVVFMAFARYNTDGSLDTSFGTGGKTKIDFGNGFNEATSLAVQADGKIIAAGTVQGLTGRDFGALRLQPDGSLDNSFGTNGLAITEVQSGEDAAQSMVLQPDGKIVLAGFSTPNGTINDFALVRYLSDGSLDTSFGGDGIVTTQITAIEDRANAVVFQEDGNLVAAGYSDNGVDNDIRVALVRYLSDFDVGTLELSAISPSILVYPNPIQEETNIQFELEQPEVLSMVIQDLNGKQLGIVVPQRHFNTGEHSVSVQLPASLSAGSYLLVITDAKQQQQAIRIQKAD